MAAAAIGVVRAGVFLTGLDDVAEERELLREGKGQQLLGWSSVGACQEGLLLVIYLLPTGIHHLHSSIFFIWALTVSLCWDIAHI